MAVISEAAINRQRQCACTVGVGGEGPGERRSRGSIRTGKSAVIYFSGDEILVHNIANRAYRRRSVARRTTQRKVSCGLVRSNAGSLPGGIGEFLLDRESRAKVKRAHNQDHKQR